MRPKGNIRIPRDNRDYVKGITSPIPYIVRNSSGDWTNFFDKDAWIEQLYQGQYDTCCCWLYSMIDCLEIQLEWLWKNGQFSPQAIDFFTLNGYLDQQGNFDLSRDFLAILSGVRNNGNSQLASWQLLSQYGIIGASTLSYSGTDATYQQFLNNFFDTNRVTPTMKSLGQQFLQYVRVAYEWIGNGNTTPPIQDLKAALLQAPLQFGIPIPQNVSTWNSSFVQYDGSTVVEHAVGGLCTSINPNGSYNIIDQYEPCIKTLSSDYYIPLVTLGYISARTPQNPLPQEQGAVIPSFWRKFWDSLKFW